MKRAVLLVLFYFALISPILCEQKSENPIIDSLLNLVPQKAVSSTELADLYNLISWEYRNTNGDSTIRYATMARDVSRRIKYDDGEIKSLNYLGIGHRNKSDYSGAFEYFVEALKRSEETGNLEQEGYSLINIGNIYIYQTNYVGAIEYFENALEPAIELDNKGMIAYCYLNLGRTFSRIEQFDKAEEYYLKTREIRTELNDVEGIITSNADIAELHRKRGNLDKALQFFFLTVEDTKEINNYGALAFSLNNIAKIFRQKYDLENAEKYALEALEVSKTHGLKNDERKILENLSLIFQLRGEHKLALNYYKEHINKRDSIFNEETTRRIEEMRSQYEAEKIKIETQILKQQAEIDQLVIQRQKIIIILSTIGILLFLILTIVAYRSAIIRKRLYHLITDQRDQALKDKELIENQSNKLEALDLAKSRFFSNISHDLRSPLSIIIGNQDQILQNEDSFLSSKSTDYLTVAQKNAKRLLYLTDEINELSKLEDGNMKLKPVLVLIEPYLKLLTSMFQSTADFKNIKLEFNSSINSGTTLSIDPFQFEKIIYNLVSNALKHSKSGDKVNIELINDDFGQISILIKDTGEGISEENLPYIFDRYYQSPKNRYHVYEGLGVGLALVKELTKLHHGNIDVESELGKGTTFILTLPNSEQVADGVVPEQSEYLLEKNSLWSELWEKTYRPEDPLELNVLNRNNDKELKILLVEDHPEVRDYIKSLIEGHFEIVEAENGKKALEKLEKHKFDLVITDLMMPWMDGFELLETMHQDEQLGKIPVLVVSARNSEADRFKVLSKGVNDILQKPFSQKELMLRINNLLDNRNKENQTNSSILIGDTNLLDDLEKELLGKIETLILERIDDSNLSVLHLADAMAASERKVYRMIKKLTDLTPYDYIKEVRWQYLQNLVQNKQVKNASEAAKSIGMKNVTNFKNQYKKRFNREVDEMLVKV